MSGRKSHYVFEYRFTILGGEKVGKSAIIHQFLNNKFLEEYKPTAENQSTHIIEYQQRLCVCLLVDTAGPDDFPAMRKLSISKGNAFIVVYSINNRKSFDRAKLFVKEIKKLKADTKENKILIVANKNDLDKDREVSYDEGKQFSEEICEENFSSSFTESTAKSYMSVENIFHKMLRLFVTPPPSTEVPVLMSQNSRDRKGSLSHRLGRRRTSKGLIQRKGSQMDDDKKKRESFSDSEVELSKDGRILSPKLFNLRKFSKTPEMKKDDKFFVFDELSTSLPKGFDKKNNIRRPSIDSFNEISRPRLLSSTCSLQRYNHVSKNNSRSTNSESSADSGLSDECNSPELSPRHRKQLYRSYTINEGIPVFLPETNKMFPSTDCLARRASSPNGPFYLGGPFESIDEKPNGNNQNFDFEESMCRSSSISGKMKGIFKKKKSIV